MNCNQGYTDHPNDPLREECVTCSKKECLLPEVTHPTDLQCFIDELIQFKKHVQGKLNEYRMGYYWTIGKMIADFMADKTHKELYGEKIVHTCGESLGIAESLLYDGMKYYETEPDFDASLIKYRNWTEVKLALSPPKEKENCLHNEVETVKRCKQCKKIIV